MADSQDDDDDDDDDQAMADPKPDPDNPHKHSRKKLTKRRVKPTAAGQPNKVTSGSQVVQKAAPNKIAKSVKKKPTKNTKLAQQMLAPTKLQPSARVTDNSGAQRATKPSSQEPSSQEPTIQEPPLFDVEDSTGKKLGKWKYNGILGNNTDTLEQVISEVESFCRYYNIRKYHLLAYSIEEE